MVGDDSFTVGRKIARGGGRKVAQMASERADLLKRCTLDLVVT